MQPWHIIKKNIEKGCLWQYFLCISPSSYNIGIPLLTNSSPPISSFLSLFFYTSQLLSTTTPSARPLAAPPSSEPPVVWLRLCSVPPPTLLPARAWTVSSTRPFAAWIMLRRPRSLLVTSLSRSVRGNTMWRSMWSNWCVILHQSSSNPCRSPLCTVSRTSVPSVSASRRVTLPGTWSRLWPARVAALVAVECPSLLTPTSSTSVWARKLGGLSMFF